MYIFYIYLVIGIVLIALELASTTFYLLIIGVACILGSISALFISGWHVPTLFVGLLSVLGCRLVQLKKAKKVAGSMIVNHLGQEVEVIEVNGVNLRVLYSGSYWDAVCERATGVNKGDKLKIVKFSNHQLVVE